MGWPPAVIIVVRHGARLDAADKQWHLTSPTPYDPPLTYGGFTQSKTLGARIASILRTRETDDEEDATPTANRGENGAQDHPDGNTRRRRHKVIIHSSPFLRCVQTSIGIAAGLAQNPGHMHRSSSSSQIPKLPHRASSPRSRPVLATNSPRLAPIVEPLAVQSPNHEQEIKKSTIRVDAFLGEWLSPDYFEQITPPPSSIMMVASAKADLLRREDYSNLVHTRDSASASANKGFPGGWRSPTAESEELPFSMSSLHHALPRRDRTSSLSSVHHNGNSPRPGPTPLVPEHGIYQPPIPSYAISSVDPIPQGYVAHARDACVDVDYQWDSMRAPQNWGNGGEYGEEWSSMHKRFRKGLQNLVNWYSEKASPFDRGNKTHSRTNSGEEVTGGMDGHAEEDDDTDLVVILVTHGAGCNALIGALTNHPVLIDVGMASLTMAVRKTAVTPRSTPTASPPESPSHHSRVGAKVQGISDEYDVKLIANTEHLRPSTTPSRASSLSSGSSTPVGIAARYSSQTLFNGNTGNPFEAGVAFGQPVNTHRSYLSGSIRRSASNTTAPSSLRTTFSISTNNSQLHNQGHRSNSIGLWSAAPAPAPAEDDVVLNFGDEDTAASNNVDRERVNEKEREREKEPVQAQQKRPETPKRVKWLGVKFDGSSDDSSSVAIKDEEEHDEVKPLGGMGAGLWGSPRPPGEAERLREGGLKRRWTVNEK